jgi:hypothetical protein
MYRADVRHYYVNKSILTVPSLYIFHCLVSGVHLNLFSKRALKSRLRMHHRLQITDQLFKSNLTFCVVCVLCAD